MFKRGNRAALSRLLWRSHCGARRAGRDAAIHEQRLACYVAARFRGEKDHGSIEIVRLARAFYGYAIGDVVNPFLVLIENFVLLGLEPSRREAVDRNAEFAPLVGEAHGQLT